jgi:hypothetical protein
VRCKTSQTAGQRDRVKCRPAKLLAAKKLRFKLTHYPLVSVLDFAQRWTAAVDWSDFRRTDEILYSVDAYTDAGIAETSGIRLRLPSA